MPVISLDKVTFPTYTSTNNVYCTVSSVIMTGTASTGLTLSGSIGTSYEVYPTDPTLVAEYTYYIEVKAAGTQATSPGGDVLWKKYGPFKYNVVCPNGLVVVDHTIYSYDLYLGVSTINY